MNITVNTTLDKLPESNELDFNRNDYDSEFIPFDYHLVYVQHYGWMKAMFINNEWYKDYCSKIVYPVLYWIELPKLEDLV